MTSLAYENNNNSGNVRKAVRALEALSQCCRALV